MARSDRLPTDSVRFFARVTGAVLECPKCGTVARFNDKRRQAHGWDAARSRFTCQHSGCGATFLIGLLAWPVARGGPGPGALPQDQVPNEGQLAQLRAEGDGHWMRGQPKTRFRAEHTNLTAQCNCPSVNAVNARCPFHGYRAKQVPDD